MANGVFESEASCARCRGSAKRPTALRRRAYEVGHREPRWRHLFGPASVSACFRAAGSEKAQMNVSFITDTVIFIHQALECQRLVAGHAIRRSLNMGGNKTALHPMQEWLIVAREAGGRFSVAMSFVGDPFEYDVFFSYAYADAAIGSTALGEWSRKVAGYLNDLVATALSVEGHGKFSYFVDTQRLMSASPLTDDLRSAVERSALLVVMMSPVYLNRPYCVQELTDFLARRDLNHCVILEALPTESEDLWPDALRDSARQRVLTRRLYDGLGPIDLAASTIGAPMVNLATPLEELATEISDKLKEEKRQRSATASYSAGQEIPDDPVLYLLAELKDKDSWDRRRKALGDRRQKIQGGTLIVLPDQVAAELQLEELKDERGVCDGLVLLRSRVPDGIFARLKRAYFDRRTIYQTTRKPIPWAVLDEAPEHPLPGGEAFRVPRVSAKESDWEIKLCNTLWPSQASEQV